jgi:hypothetical protein
MGRTVCCACLLAAAWFATSTDPAHGAGLPLSDVGRLGKAATALVELPGKTATGSAFCLNPSGIFLTNEHVVRDAGTQPLVLVLDPGLKTQRSLTVRVLRSDRSLDLALLQVERRDKLPALALGSDESLTELMDLVAFGFPFGTRLSVEDGRYPAVTVNAGRVTSLRRKGGELYRIQTDAGVQPGNSGGPVLDLDGKVIGIVVSGVVGSTVNFAIPVSHITRFLGRPQIELVAPTTLPAELHVPVQVRARVVEFLPAASPTDVEVRWQARGREEHVKMELVGGEYRGMIVPVPASEGPPLLRLTARFAHGSVSGSVEDQEFTVGGTTLRLREVRSLHPQTPSSATRQDGKTVSGRIAGLGAVPVSLGETALTLDLLRALEVTCDPPPGPDDLTLTVVASRDGKELDRVTQHLLAREQTAARGSTPPTIAGLPAGQEKLVRSLPAPVADVAVGGGGRYLILSLPRVRKLAVFDTSVKQVVRYLAVPEENVLIAAGRDKLLVVLTDRNIVQRWNLATLEREVSAMLPIKGTATAVAMGSDSDGPLAIVESAVTRGPPLVFFDVHRMVRMEVNWTQGRGEINMHRQLHVRASPDGKIFGTAGLGSPAGVGVVHLLNGRVARTYYEHVDVYHVVPGPHGDILYTGGGLFTNEAKPLHGDKPDGRNYVPAQQGIYYLELPPYRAPRDLPRASADASVFQRGVTLYARGDTRPLVSLPEVEVPLGDVRREMTSDFTLDKRIHFLPEARLLITLPASDDQVVVQRLDVDEALDKADVDYLLVTSTAPPTVKSGETYTYALVVKSKKGAVKYRLESGPPGMTVSPQGRVEWRAPRDHAEPEVDVIVSVSDATGQEAFHTFKVRFQD